MKKVLRVIGLVPLYFILVVFNNLQNLIIDKTFINVDFVNAPTVIAFTICSIIILFWDCFKNGKKTAKSILLVTIGCTLLNGYWGDKNIYKYYLLFLVLIYNAYIFSKITKLKFEMSIFASNAILMIIATVLSMFNMLKILLYVVLALQVIITIYILIKRKDLPSAEKLNYNNVGVQIFGLMFLLFVIGGINRYIHTWDEYSHWAYDATVVANTDMLSTQEGVTSATREYPPLLSNWHYFTSRIADFNEQHLYISLSIYILIMAMPAFIFVDKDNKKILPLFTIAIFFGPSLFGTVYTNTMLYADYASAISYFTAFVVYLYYRNKDEKAKNILLFLAISSMILIKPTGIINAFILFVIMAIVDYLQINNNKFNKKSILKDIVTLWKKYWRVGVSVVLVFLIWQVYVKISNNIIPQYYGKTLVPDSLRTEVSYKMNIVTIGKVLGGVLKSFDSTLILDISFLGFIVLMVAISYIAFYMNDRDSRKAFCKVLPYLIGGALYFFLTVLAIFVTFTKYEAEMVASLGRYINNFNVAIFLTLIVYLFTSDFMKNKYGKVLTVLVLTFIVLNCGVMNITYYATDLQSRAQTRDISYKRKDDLEVYLKNTPEDSQVYILDQKDETGIMAMWYARYYGFPRRTNATNKSINWKIRTQSNLWDLQDWGLTAQDLSDDLLEYNFDYLYLYTSTEEMFEQMEFMFEDYDTCRDYTLFKVEEKDGHALLIGVV